MIRTALASVALGGAIALGGAGIASAATTAPGSGSTGSGANRAALCQRAPELINRINTLEGKAASWVTKATAKEQQDKTQGNTKQADRLAKRIARVQKLEAKGHKVVAYVESACPGVSGSSSTGSSSTATA